MSGVEVAANVAAIVSTLFRAIKVLDSYVETPEDDIQLDLNAAKSRLLVALRECPKRIDDEYRKDVLRVGPPFNRGDGILGVANAALEAVLAQVRASVLDVIESAMAGTVHLKVPEYQKIQAVGSKAARDTVTTLAQLFQRTLHQAPIPTSLKHDHPWKKKFTEGSITDPNIIFMTKRGIFGRASTGYKGLFMKGGGGAHGVGENLFKDGGSYTGGYKMNEMHGYGTRRYQDGTSYDGDWYRGKKHGCGVWTFGQGAKYEGGFQNGRRHGYGLQIFRDGTAYRGDWRNDQMLGFGIVLLSSTKQEGGWEFSKMNGYGVCVSNEGWQYTGQYKAGARDGAGIEVSSTGWRTSVSPSGETYEGNWEAGQRHSYGVATWSDGRRYKGEWQHDHRYGEGLGTAQDGTTFEGTWEDDVIGHGVQTKPDGTKTSCRWAL